MHQLVGLDEMLGCQDRASGSLLLDRHIGQLLRLVHVHNHLVCERHRQAVVGFHRRFHLVLRIDVGLRSSFDRLCLRRAIQLRDFRLLEVVGLGEAGSLSLGLCGRLAGFVGRLQCLLHVLGAWHSSRSLPGHLGSSICDLRCRSRVCHELCLACRSGGGLCCLPRGVGGLLCLKHRLAHRGLRWTAAAHDGAIAGQGEERQNHELRKGPHVYIG
mmetsp:Transcript_138289/g.195746  ORF Transcript_138289/g.195746 Transcript_138289/m.195746 type:complete len:215 (+) Transcript_138289:229-873(+)